MPATVHVGGNLIEGVKVRSGQREIGWIKQYDKSTVLDLIDQAAASDTFLFGKIAMVESFVWNHADCFKGKILIFSCTVSLWALSICLIDTNSQTLTKAASRPGRRREQE